MPGVIDQNAVAGGQVVGHVEVVVARYLLQLDAVGILAGGRLDPQADHRVRGALAFVEELVGDAEADVAQAWVAGHRFLGDLRGRAAGAGGLVGRFAIDHRGVDIHLPALVPVVAAGQVEGPDVGIDLVHADVAEEDRVQRQEAVEEQLAGVVVAVGEAGLQAEGAAAEEAAGVLVDVFHAGRGRAIVLEAGAVGAGDRVGVVARLRRRLDRLDQALRLRRLGLRLDLAHALFEDHQGVLLGLVALAQLQEFLLQRLDLGLRRGLRQERGNQGGGAEDSSQRECLGHVCRSVFMAFR